MRNLAVSIGNRKARIVFGTPDGPYYDSFWFRSATWGLCFLIERVNWLNPHRQKEMNTENLMGFRHPIKRPLLFATLSLSCVMALGAGSLTLSPAKSDFENRMSGWTIHEMSKPRNQQFSLVSDAIHQGVTNVLKAQAVNTGSRWGNGA